VDKLVITGGRRLDGAITISGAKNAALPILAAALLTTDTLEVSNLPALRDVGTMIRLLERMGVRVARDDGRAALTADAVSSLEASYDLVKTMRASILVLGPMLTRFGEARVSLPGGCAIGTRPVDLLLMALEALGAEIEIDAGYAVARAKNGLKGAEIVFPKVTVGGTHTALMAAVTAEGTTVIHNAANEPEVKDLAECLIKMGAKIKGAGTSTIEIKGVAKLSGARHRVLPDRIEAGTYAIAVAMTGGDVVLEGIGEDLLSEPIEILRRAGAEITPVNRGLRVARNGGGIQAVDIATAPFPGFPTDLQAQFMALMARASGESRIQETIFENRFMHVQELARLGAKIRLEGDTAIVEGVERLRGAPVMATDLRASVSLVIAALAAEGETIVNRVYHLDRGFEQLEQKLSACGADVVRMAA
jgi:UDP-N-acetylglucosamine 1-carboxyvinyltransferase